MKLSNYRVKGRQIISIPIKKNKFSEDEYINNNYKIEINPNIEYNQNIQNLTQWNLFLSVLFTCVSS